jgi:ankyrin repeat protein
VAREASENGGGRAVLTALMVAASRGDYASARRLLPSSEVNARDRFGNTALAYAASGGHAEVVRLLLAYGADPDARNDAGASALDRAALSNRRDALELLLAASRGEHTGGVLTELDARLLEACRRADRADVAELLSRGASAESRLKGSGWTPLISACASASAETARVLLDAGADPSAAAEDGRTPLHFSAQLDDVELIRMLLARGADPERRDRRGETPLAAAVRGGAYAAARALAAGGATI